MREEKINMVADEFYIHGDFKNTLSLIEKGILIKEAISRIDCTIDELIEGMKKSAILDINKGNFRIGYYAS